MYEREEEFDFERLYRALGDREKGEKALGIAEGLEDAGNREEAVKWYKKAFRLCPEMG
jgi:tetratricopeptide (TPR) repeat protein